MFRFQFQIFVAFVWLWISSAAGCVGDTAPTASPGSDDGRDTTSDIGPDIDGPDGPGTDPIVDPEIEQDTAQEVGPDTEEPTQDPRPDPDIPVDRPPDSGAMDSDGDGILDQHEGFCWVDTDDDGTLDCYDLDSDDDGIPDEVEAGDDEPLTPPIDSNQDDEPDFQDLDSDGDGIFDEVEGTDDSDGDGKGNWIDLDSDGDYLPDSLEGTNDFDDDDIPDYLDQDSDNDWIPDWLEGVDDTDDDDIFDRFDDDSDGDGHLDADEAGDTNLETAPADTDGDRTPDFRDFDSDSDGLADSVELGCGAGSSSRTLPDSDFDTFSDMAEVAVGSDPCNAASDVYDFVEFFFILPPDEEVVASGDSAMEFSTELQQIDVHFNMDCTGSMNQEIARLKCDLTGSGCTPSVPGGIISSIAGTVANSAFGVSSFRDFPISPFGSYPDWPYRLNQQVTTDAGEAQTAVNGFSAGGGYDGPESGYETLYQIATGSGLTCAYHSSCTVDTPCGYGCGFNIGAHPPSSGFFGGVGFRDGSVPFVVHITDAVSHQGPYQPGGDDSYLPEWNTHNHTQALNALNAVSVRVLGVASLGGYGSVRAELESIATATDAVVPLCAFGSRPSSCPDDPPPPCCSTSECCTGEDGDGIPPVGGECPLVFTVDSSGSGLGSTIVDAIEFMAENITMTVTTEIIGQDYHLEDPDEDLNSACFITAVQPDHWERESTCGPSPRIVGDHFEDVTAGTQVFFLVIAENDGCVEPRQDPMLFEATINIWGDGLTLLDSLVATIIIPPEEPGGPK